LFGLSISKILFTIFVVVAVWKGFALVSRLARDRKAAAEGKVAAGGRKSAREQTVELIECRSCGAYVDPREGCSCGRQRA